MSEVKVDMNNPAAAEPPAGRRRVLLGAFLGVVALLLGSWALHYALVGRHHIETDNAYVAGDVVNVTPQVPGMVARIHVRETQRVEAGDLLVELDATDARVALARAEAELARVVRDVAGFYASTDALAAQVGARIAEVAAAEANAARARDDLKRRREVEAGGGVSAEEVAHARDAQRAAEAQLAAARAALEASRQQLIANQAQTEGTTVEDHPRVRAAAAAVREAWVAEGRTRILAPVSGEIARNAATLGAAVAPGALLMAVVPLQSVWVEANYKEGQLGRVRPGQRAVLHADLYGDDVEYTGTVLGLEAGTGSAFALLPAQNATGNWIKVVQRVPVRILLDPRQLAEHPLRIGLSMRAEIDTRTTPAAGAAPAVAEAARGTDMYAALEESAGVRVREIIAAQRVPQVAGAAAGP